MAGKPILIHATFALASLSLGVWTFLKINSVAGPHFEPIMAACTNPDYNANMEQFVSQTGYHAYEPRVGLLAFNWLVCLITQFLLELRQTYPAGVLVWGGVILVSLPYVLLSTIEAGRKGARGPIRFPMAFGLLAQVFGISVVVPAVWIPSYIFGRGRGPVSDFRVAFGVISALPGALLTLVVFRADTDSYLWTVCAGVLGGPLVTMSCVLLWRDVTPSSTSWKNAQASIRSSTRAYRFISIVGAIGWYIQIYIAYSSYNLFGGSRAMVEIWGDVWVKAKGPVAFMTLDTGVLYAAVLMIIAFQSVTKMLKTVALTPLMGPAAASWVLAELEATRYDEAPALEKKGT